LGYDYQKLKTEEKMSGHSRWSTIKRKKSKMDAQKGKIFTKLMRELMVAARYGTDPETNPRLRQAIMAAKAENMPKENIERAIKKGSGELQGEAYEECIFEGYGPGSVAVLVHTLTDNRKRTSQEIRHIFAKTRWENGRGGMRGMDVFKKGIFWLFYTGCGCGKGDGGGY
jgi:YebC/PmpR family DNA-binding regulatory protein